jgi:hypothetical protein
MSLSNAMRDLSDDEVLAIAGGDGPKPTTQGCYYAGTFYQPGQSVMQAGSMFQCTYSVNAGAYVWSPMS